MTAHRLWLIVSALTLSSFLCQGTPDGRPPSYLAKTLAAEKIIRENEQPKVTKEDWDARTIDSDDVPSLYVESLDVTMMGKYMTSLVDGRKISCFQGIKYAERTTRFKHSQMVDSIWESNQTVTFNQIEQKCTQRAYFGNMSSGQEDCLYLNVYLPGEPMELTDLPVMVFIHGGSFTGGDPSLYMPTRLLDHDVILVTIAYRLGSLGWLAAQTEDFPGNAGLSDQMNALRWVQKHIESFGGKPDMVTVFGQSAGAVSTSLIQTVAPHDEKLFSSAIVESGSALEYWAIDINPVDSFYKFAEICGCDLTSYDTVKTCLVGELTDEELSDCTHAMVEKERQEGNMGFAATSPVVQDATVGDGQYLITKMPIDYIMDLDAYDVPLMMGANRDEGSFVLGLMYLDYLVPKGYLDDADYLENDMINDIISAIGLNDPSTTIAAALKQTYFSGVDMSTFDACVPGLIDMLGVLFLKGGTYQTALHHSEYYNASTYFYSFDFMSDDSLFKWLFAGYDTLPFEGGVTHADELMYIFSLPSSLTDAQRLTSKRLTKLWTNFATYHDPTPADTKDDELGLGTWEELDPENLKFYLIEDEISVKSDYSLRWHIENNEANGGSATDLPGVGTEYPSDYDQIKKDREDYLITMCVFIVAFVIAECAAVYFWFKARG